MKTRPSTLPARYWTNLPDNPGQFRDLQNLVNSLYDMVRLDEQEQQVVHNGLGLCIVKKYRPAPVAGVDRKRAQSRCQI